ncbi:MAG: lytic transglycosylase protein [Herminiimonas sp.]|nr:lytic transglycosylase protein [Herminiimonas sp.]
MKVAIKWIVGMTFAASSAALLLPDAYAQKRSGFSATDDDVFLSLRDAARRDDAAKAIELASHLPDYPIPSYVDYYRLKPRLKDAPVAEIRDFLLRYDGSAIADRLRNDWLLELGKARDWATFDEQYPQFVLNDDMQLKCYALMSRAVKGQDVASEARALLASPRDYGDACPALIATLAQNGQFNADDLWSQIRLAAEFNNAGLARRIAVLTDAPENLLPQAIDKPALLLGRGVGTGRAAHEAFIVALGRVARTDPEQAAGALARAAQQLTPPEQALGWAQIALQASLKLAPDAAGYWRKADGAPLSAEGCQWKVRAALRAGDWTQVKAGIDAMPVSLQNDSAWIYWMGRALKAQGKPEEAQEKFQSIASQANFYGQLALEELGRKITIPARALPPTPEEIAPMAANRGFRRAFKFFDLGLRFEGYREWNWQLRKMSERQHLAAAEFARQSNVLDRMINTSDRTRIEVDFTQRFPAPFNDIMHPAVQSLGLDKAWVYGLIRQESRFVMTARSNVGASGLMQIMPATARYVARKIGMSNFSQNQVNDVNTNIVLGTNYLSMILNDLDGSQALATAAYNAGPVRSRIWRSTLTRVVEGAIFAESIPFSETRGYVKNVLSNATYYAALFENRPQSLKARLGTIAPKGFVPTDLPDPL